MMIERARSAIRRHGIAGLLRRVPYFVYWRYRYWVDHARWDRRWGTETGISEHEYLGSVGTASVEHAEWYEPIRWRWFRPMLADLAVDPTRFTFMDLGSGKGRALFFAARTGFRRVIGVEFATKLHETALRNVERFAKAEPRATAVEVVNADATTIPLPNESLVVFLNNPFRGPIMEAVVARLAERATMDAPETYVMYKQPQCAGMFDANPAFERLVTREGNGRWFMGKEPYVIYRVRRAPPALASAPRGSLA